MASHIKKYIFNYSSHTSHKYVCLCVCVLGGLKIISYFSFFNLIKASLKCVCGERNTYMHTYIHACIHTSSKHLKLVYKLDLKVLTCPSSIVTM